MAKQLSKSARADSSAGKSAAAVSSNTDAVAAAAPKPATVAEPAAVADDTVLDRAALLGVIKDMAEDLPPMIAELEANALLSANAAITQSTPSTRGSLPYSASSALGSRLS
jgi:hypothetical protein